MEQKGTEKKSFVKKQKSGIQECEQKKNRLTRNKHDLFWISQTHTQMTHTQCCCSLVDFSFDNFDDNQPTDQPNNIYPK